MEESIAIFEKETKYTVSFSKKLGNWFTKRPIEVKIDIFKEQRNLFFKLKNKNIGVSDSFITLITFYQSIDKFYQIDKNLNSKNKTMKMEKIIKGNYNEPRKRIIRDKLLDIWSEVQELRNLGASPEKVVKLARSKHRFDISREYIYKIWKEVEGVKYTLR